MRCLNLRGVRSAVVDGGRARRAGSRLAVAILAVVGMGLSGAARGQFNEFPIPTASSNPDFIVAGPDGNLWFTETAGNKIGRISTADVFTEFPIPTAGSGPFGIAVGSDGALWFAEGDGNQIGRITVAGAITEFAISTGGSIPFAITAGPDGALWFTESSGNQIGRITVSGAITEFLIPTGGSIPLGITVGSDGNLWFTESHSGKIGRLTTAGVFTEFSIPATGHSPSGIVAGPDGALWFADQSFSGTTSAIGRITTAGSITEVPLAPVNPSLISVPFGIAAGSDGNLWFTEQAGNTVGLITTSGFVSEFLIPTPHRVPAGIAPGPDGALWFAEQAGNNIGRITTTPLAPMGLAVDAAAAAGTNSNTNGVLEPGETVLIKPSWLNLSLSPVALTGTASNATGPAGAAYSLPDASADYGTIVESFVGDCGNDCYQFSVSNPTTRPAAHWDATFTETPSTGGPVLTRILHIGDSFNDVAESSPQYRFIETLFHNLVTSGCGAGIYCPGDPVTRAQMAVFLLRSQNGPSYQPPPATGTVFADVPANAFAAAFIEALAAAGVTAGCGGGNYCPADPVTRGQMAVFLLRTREGPTYQPPACVPPGPFGDVPCSSGFAPWIQELVFRGITAGCGGGNYCPGNPVTRGQMAVFLTTMFGLKLYGP